MTDFFTKVVYGGGCAVCERPFEEDGFARKAGHCEFEGRHRRAMFCRVCWEALREAPFETSGPAAPGGKGVSKAERLLGPRARPSTPPGNPACPLCERSFDAPGVLRGLVVTLSNWAVRITVCAACVQHVRERGEAL